MNLGQLLAKIIADAIDGQPVAIETLKRTLKCDPSRANPHVFWVGKKGIIFDSLKTQALQRREVLPHVSRYGNAAIMKVLAFDAREVIHQALKFPILKTRFEILAFKEIDEIEATLVLDDQLSSAGRLMYKKRLALIMDPKLPIWQNWVLALRKFQFNKIDKIIQAWLDEPVDLTEQHMFKVGWDTYPYSIMSAKKFFEHLDIEHLLFLGLKRESFKLLETGEIELLPVLTIPVKLANQRAKTLGVKFKFQSI